jgi:hypothetical protein
MPSRRSFLDRSAHGCAALIAGNIVAPIAMAAADETAGQKFLLVGLVGSENPMRANFPFVWATALKEAGHEVRIELAGDATVLMRTAI